ncbi:unnamed protein product, partial [Oncorhynchus mykiss]
HSPFSLSSLPLPSLFSPSLSPVSCFYSLSPFLTPSLSLPSLFPSLAFSLLPFSLSLQISRVLKPGGRFLSVTFAQPHFRKRLYARHDYCWSVRTRSYGDGFQYFLYVLTKGEELSPEDVTLERRLLEEAQDSPNEVRTQEEDTESFLYCIDL